MLPTHIVMETFIVNIVIDLSSPLTCHFPPREKYARFSNTTVGRIDSDIDYRNFDCWESRGARPDEQPLAGPFSIAQKIDQFLYLSHGRRPVGAVQCIIHNLANLTHGFHQRSEAIQFRRKQIGLA